MTSSKNFRVWSQLSKKWMNSIVLTSQGTPMLQYVEQDPKTKKVAHKVYLVDNYHPVVQSGTGVKDRTGIEIFEGDIVKVQEDSSKEFIDGSIVWGSYGDDEYVKNVECWMISSHNLPLSCAIGNGVDFDRGPKTIPDTLEVIRNIFENKEVKSTKETNASDTKTIQETA